MDNDRITQQVNFLMEMDKLKKVLRRNHINGGERLENTAEHSWHVSLQAVLFAEYANEPVDMYRVVKMLLFHDIVEIIAGDTYIYSKSDTQEQDLKEEKAADTLFGMLPDDQANEFKDLWHEFEGLATPESRFAKAMDRFLPIMENFNSNGLSWRNHGIKPEMVKDIILRIKPGSEQLWSYATEILDKAVAQGMFESAEK